jgi:hypothetical protein
MDSPSSDGARPLCFLAQRIPFAIQTDGIRHPARETKA